LHYLDDTAALLTSQMFDIVGEWEVILVYATKAYMDVEINASHS
jgi:hypothetical protein